jgi:hypothetical protein
MIIKMIKYKYSILFLLVSFCFHLQAQAAATSANYTLVNFVLNTNAAAEMSSSNNKTKVAAGQNLVVLSASSLYRSLPGYISQITATTGSLALDNLNTLYVYPNPYKPNSAGSIYEAAYITFRNLPEKATIKIFNISGELVATIEKDSSQNECRWDVKNDSGKSAASGLYIYYVTEPKGQTSQGKFAVIR